MSCPHNTSYAPGGRRRRVTSPRFLDHLQQGGRIATVQTDRETSLPLPWDACTSLFEIPFFSWDNKYCQQQLRPILDGPEMHCQTPVKGDPV